MAILWGCSQDGEEAGRVGESLSAARGPDMQHVSRPLAPSVQRRNVTGCYLVNSDTSRLAAAPFYLTAHALL